MVALHGLRVYDLRAIMRKTKFLRRIGNSMHISCRTSLLIFQAYSLKTRHLGLCNSPGPPLASKA